MLAQSEKIDLRITPEVKNLLTRAAAYRGLSLSSFLLETAQRSAEGLLKEQEQIALSSKDWDRFVEILDDETPPNGVLQTAARKFSALHTPAIP